MLENKLSITDSATLADAEEKIAKKRAVQLFDSGELASVEVGTFKGLCKIHKFLFGDIYDFAGQKRTVDISKRGARYTPVEALSTGLGFADIMPVETFDDIMDKFIEMVIAHPFRKGNGQALLIWLNVMLWSKLGAVADYSKIPVDAFRAAVDGCGVDDENLYNLIKRSLVKDNSRDTYLRGVDASFAYEGYTSYAAARL